MDGNSGAVDHDFGNTFDADDLTETSIAERRPMYIGEFYF